jgi:hypothetical protein
MLGKTQEHDEIDEVNKGHDLLRRRDGPAADAWMEARAGAKVLTEKSIASEAARRTIGPYADA